MPFTRDNIKRVEAAQRTHVIIYGDAGVKSTESDFILNNIRLSRLFFYSFIIFHSFHFFHSSHFFFVLLILILLILFILLIHLLTILTTPEQENVLPHDWIYGYAQGAGVPHLHHFGLGEFTVVLRHNGFTYKFKIFFFFFFFFFFLSLIHRCPTSFLPPSLFVDPKSEIMTLKN